VVAIANVPDLQPSQEFFLDVGARGDVTVAGSALLRLPDSIGPFSVSLSALQRSLNYRPQLRHLACPVAPEVVPRRVCRQRDLQKKDCVANLDRSLPRLGCGTPGYIGSECIHAGGNTRLNHLFQHAKTAAVSEYAQIAETFAPEAMEKIAAWILAVQ